MIGRSSSDVLRIPTLMEARIFSIFFIWSFPSLHSFNHSFMKNHQQKQKSVKSRTNRFKTIEKIHFWMTGILHFDSNQKRYFSRLQGVYSSGTFAVRMRPKSPLVDLEITSITITTTIPTLGRTILRSLDSKLSNVCFKFENEMKIVEIFLGVCLFRVSGVSRDTDWIRN